MEIKLLKESHTNLSELAVSWDFETDGDPTELVKAMTKLMFEQNGIGLAAPQIGVMKRLFIMGNPDNLVVCINPKIIDTSGEPKLYLEGCLSFPNLWINIKRPTNVTVEYTSLTGTIVKQDLTGLPARVFLHEYDHLNGMTFDERCSAKLLVYSCLFRHNIG